MEILQSASAKLGSSIDQGGRNHDYQRNVKLFIQSVEQEVSTLIQNYESKIK